MTRKIQVDESSEEEEVSAPINQSSNPWLQQNGSGNLISSFLYFENLFLNDISFIQSIKNRFSSQISIYQIWLLL